MYVDLVDKRAIVIKEFWYALAKHRGTTYNKRNPHSIKLPKTKITKKEINKIMDDILKKYKCTKYKKSIMIITGLRKRNEKKKETKQ